MAAVRTMTILDGSQRTSLEVSIAEPCRCEDGHFSCAYTIAWPGKPWTGEACGYDGIQALLLAMNLIAAHLYNSAYHQDDRLVWGEHEDGYGFPLAKCLKDLARGSDKDL